MKKEDIGDQKYFFVKEKKIVKLVWDTSMF